MSWQKMPVFCFLLRISENQFILIYNLCVFLKDVTQSKGITYMKSTLRIMPAAAAAAALILVGAPVFAQEAPPGAGATGCDVSQYTPVISERTGEVLYWTNSSCPAGSGGTDQAAPTAPSIPVSPPNDDNSYDDGCGGCEGIEITDSEIQPR